MKKKYNNEIILLIITFLAIVCEFFLIYINAGKQYVETKAYILQCITTICWIITSAIAIGMLNKLKGD